MTVINTNSAALRAQNGSRLANEALNTAMARLSSGKRINTASDDAAGLAVSNSMTSQINGMNQAISNANDGISLAQTADGSLDEVTNNLQRIRELAVQSASGTYSDDDRANMQAEVAQLTQQIGTTLSSAAFNNVPLFDTSATGTGNSTSIQVGANAGDTVAIKIGNLGMAGITGSSDYVAPSADYVPASADYDATAGTGTAQVGTAGSGTPPLSVASAASASASLSTIDAAMQKVDTVRAGLGASESQLNSVVNNLTNDVTNLTDANSRISDADFSVETTNLAKAQILSQASTAMLAQANQSQQGVLKLLQQ